MFLVALLNLDAMIEESLHRLEPKAVQVALIDTTGGGESLVTVKQGDGRNDAGAETAHNEGLYSKYPLVQRDITLGDRSYTLRVAATKSYIKERRNMHFWTVPVGSGLLGLMICILFYRQFTEKERISSLAVEKSQELFESRERFHLAIEGANLGVWDWNISTGEMIYNRRFEENLGYRAGELDPDIKSWDKLIHPDDREEVRKSLGDHLEGLVPFYRAEHRLMEKNNRWRWFLGMGKIVERDQGGKPLRVTGISLDISETKEYQEQLKSLSNTDPLTKITNRRYFSSVMDNQISLFRRTGESFSLCILDLDHFKEINDSYGHTAGDEVLKRFASLLLIHTRPYDVVSRMGGDEFIIILPRTDKETALLVAERIREAQATEEFIFGGNNFRVNLSCGLGEVQEVDREILDAEHFFEFVDRRLYRAKTAGRDKIIWS